MNTYRIELIEKVKVIYKIEATSKEEALSKARNGEGYCDSILLGEPDESYQLELLDGEF